MHGIPSLIKARSKRGKIVWGIVCVLGMLMFIYMLISLVFKYFEYKVIVKVDQVGIYRSYYAAVLLSIKIIE